MLPAGLVWGRAGATAAVDGTMMTASVTAPPAAQPLLYCYSPAAAAADVQLPASSLTYHQQLLQQQQQQQVLLAAKSLQQQQQAAQQLYVQTGFGLQPYRLPAASPISTASAGLQLHGSLALTPNLAYISPDQVYLPSPPSAAASTSVALTSGRKVRPSLVAPSLCYQAGTAATFC